MKQKNIFRFCTLVVYFAIVLFQKNSYAQDYEKLAPFSAVRWEDKTNDTPQILLDGKWYILDSIDKIQSTEIIEFCKDSYGSKWQKRFGEDLVQVLSEMGHPPKDEVSLAVQELSDREKKLTISAEMTEANRTSVYEANYKDDAKSNTNTKDYYNAKEALLLVYHLNIELEERFAYLTTNNADYKTALRNLGEKTKNGISKDRLGIEMQKVIALFIDGHARIEGYKLPGGYLPFLIESIGDKFVAFHADRKNFVNNDFPFITKIDGKPIADWIKMSIPLISKGSPQYVKRHALRIMRNLNFLREENGLEIKPNLEVELVSENGSRKTSIELKIADRSPAYGKWPETQTKILDGNIGYLRILSMHEEYDEIVKEWMPKFKDTEALIMDVRDNGGGSRVALRLIFPYLFNETDLPHVVNSSAYRLHKEYGTDHLDARYSYHENSKKWTQEEKNAIRIFNKTFKSEVKIPRSGFSGMHYMVMSKTTTSPAFHYSKPVVILMNQKCFSATDIFLSAFKGWHNVTLIGVPSGGGSARSIRIKLGDSDLIVRLASMISFQKDGKLYDTNGVFPDIQVEPVPEYFLRNGHDNILDFALSFLKK